MRESFELVQRLFDETADLAPDARRGVLRARLGDRADVLREVEELVRADARAPGLDERLRAAVASDLAEDDGPEALDGPTVGIYRIEEPLSAGGMGSVYRATRVHDGTERAVALKVLRRGLDTAALLARFRREQRSLARLRHENVVGFLDSGALEDGRPYLVMELVDGLPVTRWCDERGLGLRERLELFRRVLAAVGHAHRNLIVHCDLKPSNVLVGESGAPKLLDFGIATLLAEDGAASATRLGRAAPLTPAYASPEQLRGEPVTTASDVFALGAILYELLCGAPPFAEPRDADALPPPPSERAPAARARALRGDLDRIALAALAPDPRRRYPSVERLADDVAAFLEGRPVSARPATAAYLASRFARRHRWAVALGAAALLALVAGLGGAELGRRRALAEASRGWGAHVEAKRAARFLEDLLAATAATEPERWLAVAAEREAELARFEGAPEAEALVRLALARLYLERSQPDRAREHARRVLELAAAGVGAIGPREVERARELLERAGGP